MSSNVARIAEATVCDAKGCYDGHLMVRGDQISFLSVQRWKQLQKKGYKREVQNGDVIWTPEMPKSDIELPSGFVLVHDTTGELLSKCDLYVLKWRGKKSTNAGKSDADLINEKLLRDAEEYFVSESGKELRPGLGVVEIPDGSWTKVASVQFIRYRRPGFVKPFEHDYDPAVDVYDCLSPLAWRLPLPTGCVVDSRGFVWP